ncbi:MAG: T9SS type A sorting domain-containing protein [Bacteroidetes bacterium]|nr:T9SS type A sorting domain-containing protein [Bacteroidota bacterium]MBU1720398.1 T9SS type A sorting domain-containing protein [Bacteroidota bacterium]
MKKNLRVLFATALAIFWGQAIIAQVVLTNDFETWSGNIPSGFTGNATNLPADSIAQYTTSVHGGTYACKLTNGSTSHKRFTSNAFAVTAGDVFDIKVWVRGHGDIRGGLYNPADTSYSYSSYSAINSSSWSQVTFTLGASLSSASAEFILSIVGTASDLDHLQIDDLEVSMASITTTTIHDIQYTTATPADSPLKDQIVTTNGIVTAKYGSGYWIQDGTGAWNGVYVYDIAHTPALGDDITITALVTEYYELTELKTVSAYVVNSTGNTLPAVTPISTADGNTEQYEGVLVKVANANCTNAAAGNGMWIVNDGSGDLLIDDVIYAFPSPAVSTHYDVTGVGHYAFSEWKILPRSVSDVSVSSSVSENTTPGISVYPNPATDQIRILNAENNSQFVVLNALGMQITSGTTTPNQTVINVSNWSTGVYFIRLSNGGNSRTIRFVKE